MKLINLALKSSPVPERSNGAISNRRNSRAAPICTIILLATICLPAVSQSASQTDLGTSEQTANKTTAALALDTTVATEIAALYSGNGIHFSIYRDDKRVGKHSLRFQSDGDELAILIDSSIRITILKVPVFTLRYTSSESWRGDQLLSATATTRENRNSNTVSLINDGSQSILSTLDGPKQVERLSYASNHWNANILSAGRFFNTLTGEASDIGIEFLGEETITTASGTVLANHFRYTGDVQTDVWYDSSGRWVGLAFNADDGSRIRYELSD